MVSPTTTTARRDLSRAHRRGFTLLELLVVIAIMAVLTGLLLAAVQKVRASAAKVSCQNNLKQLGLGLHQYHDAHHALPPGLRTKDDPYLYLSWSARLLPYLEQQALWRQTEQQYAADPNPMNLKIPDHPNLAIPVPVFLCPAGDRATGIAPRGYPVAFTWYLGVNGQCAATTDGVLYRDSHVRFVDVTDGTSQTLAVGERPPSPDSFWGWWYAGVGQEGDGSGDMVLGVTEYRNTYRLPTCPRGPYHFTRGRLDEMCDVLHFWSLHPGGANFLFADGSVRFFNYSAASVLPDLATRAGG